MSVQIELNHEPSANYKIFDDRIELQLDSMLMGLQIRDIWAFTR